MRLRARHALAMVAALAGVGLALVSTQAGAASSYPAAITGGQTLTSGSILESPDGRYEATFNNGVLSDMITGGRTLWTTGTAQTGDYAVLQPNGQLVIFDPTGQVQWTSGVSGTGCPVLEMQVDGNLVDYDTAALWSAHSELHGMVAGDKLLPGQNIYSSGGLYRLAMNANGDLVLYNDSSKAIWSSATSGTGAYAEMLGNGDFVVYSAAGKALWTSGTSADTGASLDVQSDGNLVVYSKGGTAEWESKSTGKAGSGSPFPLQGIKASATPCPSTVAPPTTTVVATQTQTVTDTQTVLVPTTTVLTVAAPAPTKLRRFDVKVATRWAFVGNTTVLQAMAVGTLPKGVRITATYNPHLRHRRATSLHAVRGRTLVALVKHLRAIRYRPGQTLNLNLTRAGYEHEWATFTFRSGKLPLIKPVSVKR